MAEDDEEQEEVIDTSLTLCWGCGIVYEGGGYCWNCPHTEGEKVG